MITVVIMESSQSLLGKAGVHKGDPWDIGFLTHILKDIWGLSGPSSLTADLTHGPIYLQGRFPQCPGCSPFSCPTLMCLVGAGAHHMGCEGLSKVAYVHSIPHHLSPMW